MAAIATLAVSLSELQALRPRQRLAGLDRIALTLLLSLVLTATADRALFGRRHRGFWLGFTVAGWLCAAWAFTHLQETRSYLLRYGPPIVRARNNSLIAVHWALLRRVPPPPPPPEWYLLMSMVTELGLGLALGILAASAGGLFAVSLMLLVRQTSRLAQRLKLPNPTLHWPRPAVPPESGDP